MLILVMSMSGSIVFLAILLSIYSGKRILSSIWIYNMLRINLIFFCLPFPLFRYIYSDIWSMILGKSIVKKTLNHPLKNVIHINVDGTLYFDWDLYIYIIWAIWLAGLIFAFIKHTNQYHNLKSYKESLIDDNDYLNILEKVKQKLNMKEKITLACAKDSLTICTMGITKKYIILPGNGINEEDLFCIFKHELIHIKRKDVMFRYIVLLTMMVHWFNPLIYLYFYVISIYCEQSCDAILVRDFDDAERRKYGELIINSAINKTKNKYQSITFFSNSKKIIEGRLKNMFEFKKLKGRAKVFSFVIGGLIIFCGTLPVFAYEGPTVAIWKTESRLKGLEYEQIEREFIEENDVRFSNRGAMTEKMFVGEDGSSYILNDSQNISFEKTICNHSYKSGYAKEHVRFSDNSCKTDVYFADMCQKCGDVVNKGFSHTDTSIRCTH